MLVTAKLPFNEKTKFNLESAIKSGAYEKPNKCSVKCLDFLSKLL